MFSKSGTGFDGWSGAKRRLDKDIAMRRALEAGLELPAPPEELAKSLKPLYLPAWGLHDFRRSFSTMMNERGLADPHVIEALLAHQGVQVGVAGVYNNAAYRDAKSAALATWARIVLATVEQN